VHEVAPLAFPATSATPATPPALDELARSEAVQLFLARAQARRADFALGPANAAAIAEICRQLDGIPLAIELAAARITSLPVEGIAARLNDRFALLTGGPRNLLPRQRTLRAALDWSYELLGSTERSVLRRLSVFAGGWTAAAAASICGSGDAHDAVPQALEALVAKSLVHGGELAGEARFWLLETIRAYAADRLRAEDDVAAIRDRHREWYCRLVAEAEQALVGSEQGSWLKQLEAELDNVRAALRWSLLEQHQPDQGVALATGLWQFWERRGHLREGRDWLDVALRQRDAASPTLRANALLRAGALAISQSEYAQAEGFLLESLVTYRASGDQRGISAALHGLGTIAHDRGDYDRARALYEEGLAVNRALGDSVRSAASLNNLANMAFDLGQDDTAQRLHEESLELERQIDDTWGVAISLTNLGNVARRKGNSEQARARYQHALALFQELGDRGGAASVFYNLGCVALSEGDPRGAQQLYRECVRIKRELGDSLALAEALVSLAAIAKADQLPERATWLLGVVSMAQEAIGAPLPPEFREQFEHTIASARAALGAEEFRNAWEGGRATPLQQAVAEVLAPEGEAAAGADIRA